MLLFIRYTSGLGDAAIYTRLRNSQGYFWDFDAHTWVSALTEACKVYLAESLGTGDGDVDSLYSATETIPAGGPWVEETVLVSTGKVIGYDNTTGAVDTETLNWKQSLFAYVGHSDNVFSIVQGSFSGVSINFYTCSFADFTASPGAPSNETLICTLDPTGVMGNVTNIGTSGEVLYFRLPATFNCLADLIINIYAAYTKGNTRIYVPLGVQTIVPEYVYYPTASAGLLVYENSNLINFAETAYGKSLGMIPGINWDRISQPVNLVTTQVVV